MIDPIGAAPISKPLFLVGKLSMYVCWIFYPLKFFFPGLTFYDSSAARTIGIILYVAGLLVAALAIWNLGGSTRVGLAKESTELKTGGIYRFSRNPMYVGLFAMALGSCGFALHWINCLLAGFAILVHHRVVLAEERFLEERFGSAYIGYRSRVRRY